MLKDWAEFVALGLLACLVAAGLAWRAQPEIDPVEVRWAALEGRTYQLVDARRPEQYQRSHLPGAYSLPGMEMPLVPEILRAGTTDMVVYGDRLGETVNTARALAAYQSKPVMILLDPPLSHP